MRTNVVIKLPVLFAGGDGVAHWATSDELVEMKRAGVVHIFRKKRGRGEISGAVYVSGPSRPHAGTKYYHCHFVSETYLDRDGGLRQRPEMEANASGVYMLKPIDARDQVKFRCVQLSCGAKLLRRLVSYNKARVIEFPKQRRAAEVRKVA